LGIHESKADGKALVAVTKGDRAVIQSDTGWKTLAEMSRGKDKPSADLVELANARTPADELAALSSKLSELKVESDDSYSGKLDAADAKAIMAFLVKHRAPMPNMEVSSASGSLRIWLKDGLLRKYVLTTAGAISLPFGKKEINRIATVSITDFGTTQLEVPAEAKAKLETTNER
jgi:hypothetical protein